MNGMSRLTFGRCVALDSCSVPARRHSAELLEKQEDFEVLSPGP